MDLAALRKSPLALAAAFCSAVTLHSGLAHADIVADGATATTVDRIGGAEVVNIARPSAGGVSHNTFDRFSVGTEGAVINNSRVDGTSALAGDLAANPNLADGTARIILNEVTSNRRSDLNGTTELFGDNARYILANPNGITCDGCGFIRTPTAVGDAGTRLQEVLLSTAVPGLDALDGATVRLTVDRNNTAQLIIGAGGLDASNVDITTLLTRQASVNGLVEALGGQLQLYAGAGEMTVADGAAATWQPDTAAGGRDVSVAIDASAAGAMHAGQIFIRATDAGTGVSLPTDLLASGDIEITAAGDLVYRDARSEAGDVRIDTTAAGADLASDGLTQAAGDVVLAADGDVQAAQLRAGGDVAVTSRSGRLTAGEVTAGGAVDLASQDDLVYGSAEAQGGDVTIGTTDARAGSRTTGSTVAAGDVTWQISGDTAQITDGPGQLSAGGAINLHCAAGDGACRVVSQRDLTLAAGRLNTQADIETAAGRDLTIQADLDSGRRLDSGGDLRIAAAAGDIRSTGSLRAAGDMTLVTAAGAQLILDGSLVAGGELYLQGDGSYRHDATGTQQIGGQRHIDLYELVNQGVLADLADGALRVSRLDNQGLIENQGALRLQVDERLDNSGLIVSLEGAVDIGHRLPGEVTGQIHNSGLITALDLTNNQLGQSGMILDPSDLVMAHTRAILDGRQRSAADLTREIQDANARLIAELNLDEAVTGVVGIQAERLTQTGTGRISGSDVNLQVGTLANQGGQITAGRNLSITGEVLSNGNVAPYYGVISAGRRLQATLGQRLDNSGMIEGGNVILDAPVINNTGGGWTPVTPAGGEIVTAGYLDALGGQAWFAQSGGDYRHILRPLYDNDLLVSDPTRLTRAFLDAGGIRLGPNAQLAGDDVYLAELLMHTLRAQGGMTFATDDRNGLGQLSTLYANTRAYMEATGLAFGQLPDSSQRAAIRAPVLVFAPQAQADGRTLYVPRLLLPEAGDGLQRRAERLSAQIVAQENLFLKGETITNRDADLLAGDNLVIEAVDLNISGRQRDWYVDADGQVRYRTAQIAAGNDVVVQLSGRYVQDGAQVLAGNQVLVQAQSIDIADRRRTPPAHLAQERPLRHIAVAAPWSGLMKLQARRAQTAEPKRVTMAGNATYRAGDAGTANVQGGSVLLIAQDDMTLTQADIRAVRSSATPSVASMTAGSSSADGSLVLVARGGDITQQAGYLSGESILMQAEGDIRTASVMSVRERQWDMADRRGNRFHYFNDGDQRTRTQSTVRAEQVTVDVAEIEAGEGGLVQVAGNDIENRGTALVSAGDIVQQAGGDIVNESLAQRYLREQVTTHRSTREDYSLVSSSDTQRTLHDVQVQRASLQAAGDIIQEAGGHIRHIGAEVTAGGDILQQAGEGIENATLLASASDRRQRETWQKETPDDDSFFGRRQVRDDGPSDVTTHQRRDVIGTLEAGGDIVARVEDGDYRNSGNLAAGGDIVVAARDIRNNRLVSGRGNEAVILDTGRLAAGGDILLSAERDIVDTAGRYRAEGDILLQAGGDIRQEAIRIDRSSGTISRGWFTYGSKTREIDHTVGRFTAGGAMVIDADGDVMLAGSQVQAGDIRIRGENVRLEALRNLRETETIQGAREIRRTVRHDVVTLASRGDLAIQAGQDLITYGSRIRAGDGEDSMLSLNAGGDMRLLGVNNEDYYYYYRKKKKSFGRSKTTIIESRDVKLVETELASGGNVFVNLGAEGPQESGRVVLEGTRIAAGQDLMLYAGDSLNVLSGFEYSTYRKERHKSGFGGFSKSGSVHRSEAQRLGHAELTSGGDTILLAAGDINVVAGRIRAENIMADAGYQSGDDREANINIVGEKEALATFTHSYRSGVTLKLDDNFFSVAEETHDRHWQTTETYIGSSLQAANSILLRANTDINIIGSQLQANGNLVAEAGRDLNVLAGVSHEADHREFETTRIGIGYESLDNGFEIFAGAETRRSGEENHQYLSAGRFADAEEEGELTGSQLLAANIRLQAEEDVTLAGAEIYTWQLAGEDGGENGEKDDEDRIEAQGYGREDEVAYGDIEIRAGGDLHTIASLDEDRLTAYEERLRVGIKLSAQENVSEAKSATETAADEGGVANGLRAIDAIQGARSSSVSASAAIVAEYSRSESETSQTTVRPTVIQSAGDLRLVSGGDQHHQGTQAYAGEDLKMAAGGSIHIESAQQTFDQSSDSISASVSYGLGTEEAAISASLGASEHDNREAYQYNARFQAGDQVRISSTGNTRIEGAVVSGERIQADIGGNLIVASRQDTGKERGWSANVSGSTTGSFSVAGSKTEGDKQWVEEQTALRASDAVDIEVGGHTALKGAVIESGNGNLRLDTQTLAFSDIHDQDAYEYVSVSVGMQTGQSCSASGATDCGSKQTGSRETRVNSVDAQYESYDKAQVNRATIGAGTIIVRQDAETGRDSTAGLNRDLALAQESTRDRSRDYDVYYSDTSFDTIANTFNGNKGHNLIETLRPDLIVAEVAGSTVSGLDSVDNAIYDAVTLNIEGTDAAGNRIGKPEYTTRGWLDDAGTHAQGKRTEASLKAVTAGLGTYTTDTGERRMIGQDTTWSERRDALLGGRGVAEAARGDKKTINQLTDADSEAVRVALEQVARNASGQDDLTFSFNDDEANSLAAGAKGYYHENPDGPDRAGLNTDQVDISNPREVMNTTAHEGRHGLTEGSSNNEEALATLYGQEAGYQWVRRNHIERDRVGGSASADEWREREDVRSLVSEGNAILGSISSSDLDFRRLDTHEIDLAKKYASQYQGWVKRTTGEEITMGEAEGRLVRQMLRWADHETAEADGFREDQSVLSFIGRQSIVVTEAEYYDPSINRDLEGVDPAIYINAEYQRLIGATPDELAADRQFNATIGSVAVGVSPVGIAQDWATLISGADPLTGESVPFWLAALGIIPGASEIRAVTKLGDEVPISAVQKESDTTWLQNWEGIGIGRSVGHTLDVHVGQSDNDLLVRLESNSRIRGASTFTDQSIAESVIGQTISTNRNQINAWVRSAKPGDRLRLDYTGTDVVGRGATRGIGVSDRTNARVIIQMRENGKYHILTAYPE